MLRGRSSLVLTHTPHPPASLTAAKLKPQELVMARLGDEHGISESGMTGTARAVEFVRETVDCVWALRVGLMEPPE